MSDRISDELRWQMEEAATLPPDAPKRQAVAREVTRLGAEAEAQWLELLQQDEKLRLELRGVDPPNGLHDRLLSEAPPTRARRASPLRRAAIGAAALAILVTVLAGAMRWLPSGEGHQPAALAPRLVGDHSSEPALTVRADETTRLIERLRGASELPVHIPHLGDGYRLVGGRICRVDDEPAVYTRWRQGDRLHSLYQFNAEAIALDGSAKPHRVSVPRRDAAGPGYAVVFWPGHECVYALVKQPGDPTTAATGERS